LKNLSEFYKKTLLKMSKFLDISGFLCYNTSMDTINMTPEYKLNYDSLLARIDEQAATISKMAALIAHYEEQILLLNRRRFGTSSEKTDIDFRQVTLFGQPPDTVIPEPETEEIKYTRKKRKGKREEDLSGLPVERIDYELPEEERYCPQCGEGMVDIGSDVRRELKIIPAQVVVVEHAAHAYACKNCQKNSESTPIAKAESPEPLIAGSLASPSFVAHVIAQKSI
jgi:hypothetical protein